MFRKTFQRRNFGQPQGGPQRGFRWRGGDVTRLEQFSDATFAFAVTLLVVSLEVPRTLNDLVATMRGFIAFGICFTMLVWLWYEHYLFFRRYGLRDGKNVVINSALLFVILFYIYPLKFLFTLLVNGFFLGDIRVTMHDGTIGYPMTEEQAPLMMYIYNAGFFCVMGLYWMLYRRALNIREKLQLTPLEIFETKFHARGFLLCMFIALISSGIVYFGGQQGSMWGGFFYFFVGPTMWINGRMSGKRRELLESQQPAQPQGQQRQNQGRDQRGQGQQNQQRQQGQQNQGRQQFNPRREQHRRPPQPPRQSPEEPPKPDQG